MKVLLALTLLMGVVFGDQVVMNKDKEICSIINGRSAHNKLSWVNITVPDATSTTEFRNGDTLTASVQVPSNMTIDFAVCLAQIGLRGDRMNDEACLNATGMGNTATCVYPVNIQKREAMKITIRVAVALNNGGDKSLVFSTSDPVQFMPPVGGAAQPATRLPTTTTTSAPSTTKKEETNDNDQNEAVDFHDPKLEAYLAAKYAEMKQKMIEKEDQDSEGDWQKVEAERKRQHDDEMQEELREYEMAAARDKRMHEERMREEMRDKEEHDRIEAEAARRVTPQPNDGAVIPGDSDQREQEIEVNDNNQPAGALPQVAVDPLCPTCSGFTTRFSVVSVLLALVVAFFY